MQLFTGPHADYHGKGDTPDKIDAQGLSTVAAVVKEAVEYLGSREEPLTVQIPGRQSSPAEALKGGKAGERKVSFGVIPDFAFEGPGVRVGDVVQGSAAQKSGLRGGDVVTAVNGMKLADLKGFSAVLKSLSPGDRATINYTRDGADHSVATVLEER